MENKEIKCDERESSLDIPSCKKVTILINES